MSQIEPHHTNHPEVLFTLALTDVVKKQTVMYVGEGTGKH